MRTRLIRPEFFSDETLAPLDAGCKLFYIGLWCVTDDEGVFVYRKREIAAALFAYEPVAEREANVERWLTSLIALGRVRVYECGRHAVVPTIPRHKIKGGTQSSTYAKQHRRDCLYVLVHTLPAGTDTDTDTDTDTETDKYGRVRTLAEELTARGLPVPAKNGAKKPAALALGGEGANNTASSEPAGSPDTVAEEGA